MLEIKIAKWCPVEFDGLTIVEGATWAEFQISIGAVSLTARSEKEPFVYGSVFHLARFLAENYFLLLREEKSDREGWEEEHNIFRCREGMPYPRLTISSFDEEHVLLEWSPTECCNHSGSVELPRDQVEEVIQQFLEAVTENLCNTVFGKGEEDSDFLYFLDLIGNLRNSLQFGG